MKEKIALQEITEAFSSSLGTEKTQALIEEAVRGAGLSLKDSYSNEEILKICGILEAKGEGFIKTIAGVMTAKIICSTQDMRKINGLIINLQAANRKIEDWSKNLEEKVKVRTRELMKARDAMAVMVRDLERAKAYIEDILRNFLDSLIVTDMDGTIGMVNRVALDLLGYREEELAGKPINLISDQQVLLDMVLREGKVHNQEVVFKKKDGSPVPMLFSGSVMKNKEGELTGIVNVAKSIAELREKEEDLRVTYGQLKATQAQLIQSAKMASVGLLAGGVAHEINNPLTGVLNNVQLIRMMAGQKKDFNMDDFKELLAAVENSALRCKNITQALLNFSHASKGLFKPLSLNEIIDKVFILIEHELKLENISIRKELQPDLPQIKGDSQLLQQIIFDIVNNAQWAIQNKSAEKNGNIILKTQYNPEKKAIVLSISDDGLGIPKENLDKIFEPFFTTKQVGEGTGLGLSIVYNIIEAHRGSIEVESETGKGATFRISLPVST